MWESFIRGRVKRKNRQFVMTHVPLSPEIYFFNEKKKKDPNQFLIIFNDNDYKLTFR